MASTIPKDHSIMAYPRTLLTIIASVGGLAVFLFLASSLLVSQPIGYAVRNYFYGVASSQRVETSVNDSVDDAPFHDNVVEKEGKLNSTVLDKNGIDFSQASSQNSGGEGYRKGDEAGKENQASDSSENDGSFKSGQKKGNDTSSSTTSETITQVIDQLPNEKSDGKNGKEADDIGKSNQAPNLSGESESSESGQGDVKGKPSPATVLENSTTQILEQHTSEKSSDKGDNDGAVVGQNNQALKSPDKDGSSVPGQGPEAVNSSPIASSGNSTTQSSMKDENSAPPSGGRTNVVTSSSPSNRSGSDLFDSECDLYHGKWIYDSAGPLYTNNSCPVLTQMQNCQGNGRPDKDYENWRWKPMQCDLPRFDPRKFLELMRGKTLAFIGDSVARNQMESMLCILWQAEEPKNRGNKKMQRYFFRSTSTMIVRIWSSWLVHQTSEPFDFAPAGVTKLHLDAPDEGFMEFIKEFDVIVLSSGHWFAKQSVYILNNTIVGGQLWWPDKSKQIQINNVEAFAISVETILSALVTHPDYSGLTIVRSYSPDHYEGGAWNTGGSCTGKVKPATDSELAENGFTNIMHQKQVTGFNRALRKQTNKSRLKLMDITQVFSYRHDGHPGPYRSPDPNKITKRGPDGRPPPQDCLHWCMPGPVDTWNELVFEIIRRELK